MLNERQRGPFIKRRNEYYAEALSVLFLQATLIWGACVIRITQLSLLVDAQNAFY